MYIRIYIYKYTFVCHHTKTECPSSFSVSDKVYVCAHCAFIQTPMVIPRCDVYDEDDELVSGNSNTCVYTVHVKSNTIYTNRLTARYTTKSEPNAVPLFSPQPLDDRR